MCRVALVGRVTRRRCRHRRRLSTRRAACGRKTGRHPRRAQHALLCLSERLHTRLRFRRPIALDRTSTSACACALAGVGVRAGASRASERPELGRGLLALSSGSGARLIAGGLGARGLLLCFARSARAHLLPLAQDGHPRLGVSRHARAPRCVRLRSTQLDLWSPPHVCLCLRLFRRGLSTLEASPRRASLERRAAHGCGERARARLARVRWGGAFERELAAAAARAGAGGSCGARCSCLG